MTAAYSRKPETRIWMCRSGIKYRGPLGSSGDKLQKKGVFRRQVEKGVYQ